MLDNNGSPAITSSGDAWKVTVEQWREGLPGDEPTSLPDATAYAIAHNAEDAARIIDTIFTTNHGPITRVVRVEYAGSCWQEVSA